MTPQYIPFVNLSLASLIYRALAEEPKIKRRKMFYFLPNNTYNNIDDSKMHYDSKRSQTEKVAYCVIPIIWQSEKSKTIGKED